MVSVTISLDTKTKTRIDSFSWINWSEIARTDALKREIFERYLKTRKLSSSDAEFCESIDWHPVDELELKPEFVKRLQAMEKGKHSKAMTPEEFRKYIVNP